jgi:rfaE bifunctional protein kinase chain/domain
MLRERYQEIVRGFAGRSIVVLGDLMIDEYLWGNATRISPESPVMVVEVERDSRVPGGAANVVNNLLALGARVSVLGIVGDDEMGLALRTALVDSGADVAGIVTDPNRPTTRKTRVVAHSQQVMRVDREQTHPISDTVADELLDHLNSALRNGEALLVSDYNKGVLTDRLAREAVTMTRHFDVLLTANPKPPNAKFLAGADVITLNQSEAEALAGSHKFSGKIDLDGAGTELAAALDVKALIVTRGSFGLSLWCRSGESHHIPAHPVEVYDVAGAGDTVISALTAGAAAGAAIHEAAEVANHAAACVVRKLGVATVTPEELLADWRRE